MKELGGKRVVDEDYLKFKFDRIDKKFLYCVGDKGKLVRITVRI